MKIVKTYNQVVNESADNRHLLTQEQIDWCNTHIKEKWSVNSSGEVFVWDEEVNLVGIFDRFKVKFADCKSFLFDSHKLTSLEGSPTRIKTNFHANSCNSLTSLEGGPIWVGGNCLINNSYIETLEGSPEYVGGYFNISSGNNSLISLKGSPKEVVGTYSCQFNHGLTNLIGISQKIGKLQLRYCKSLTSLDGLSKDVPVENIFIEFCGLPADELIYNWQNDITIDEIDQFKSDWEI